MTAYTIPKPADRAEWLEVRRPFFNASVAAALFDQHPFLTLTDVVAEKLDQADPEEENDAMKRGRHLEPAIASWWADEHGVAVHEPEVMYANGPLLATLDRLIVGVELAALEVKSTKKEIVEPERYWWWQVQAQMHCADLDVVFIAAMDGTQQLHSFRVERDNEAIERLVCKATSVMASIKAGLWPTDVPNSWPRREPDTSIELDADTHSAVKELCTVRAQLTELEADEKHLRTLLAQRLGDATSGTVNGKPVVTFRSSTRQTLDQTRLRADHPELVADYVRPLVVRSMRVTP